jgi:hypothetical protein
MTRNYCHLTNLHKKSAGLKMNLLDNTFCTSLFGWPDWSEQAYVLPINEITEPIDLWLGLDR